VNAHQLGEVEQKVRLKFFQGFFQKFSVPDITDLVLTGGSSKLTAFYLGYDFAVVLPV